MYWSTCSCLMKWKLNRVYAPTLDYAYGMTVDNISGDDRRNLIIRSSDEKCGDKEYFQKLHEMIEDVNVVLL
jgi:hypothetical protein